MVNAHLDAVERYRSGRMTRLRIVPRVAHDGMSLLCELRPNLMGPTCIQINLYKRLLADNLQWST